MSGRVENKDKIFTILTIYIYQKYPSVIKFNSNNKVPPIRVCNHISA